MLSIGNKNRRKKLHCRYDLYHVRAGKMSSHCSYSNLKMGHSSEASSSEMHKCEKTAEDDQLSTD